MSDNEHIGTLDSAEGSFEDNGFVLTLHTDEAGTIRIPSPQTADALLKALAPLADWIIEYRGYKTDYERGRLAREAYDADAYDLDDPKHPTYHDRYAAFYDDRDKGTVGP